jgi:signal peptidase I
MWRYIIRILSSLIIIVILMVTGWMLYARVTGNSLLSVQSGSMAPAIRVGDLVIISPTHDGNYLAGDIINFSSDLESTGLTVTHRVVEAPGSKNHYKYITKGDANKTSDDPINPSSINGKVTKTIPMAGRVFDFARSWFGLILFVYLPAGAIIINEIWRVVQYYRKATDLAKGGADEG